MRNVTKETLENYRPEVSAESAIDYCLERLYADERHHTGDVVSSGLTYEEVIGALLMARDRNKTEEWIPGSERLPQDDDRYLVVRDSETMLVAYWGGGIFHYPNDTEVSEVTHWMPLPEPPTG